MINLRRNKRKLYVCKLTVTGNISTYGTPTELYENYQTTTTSADITMFGMDAYKYIRIKTSKSNAQYYQLGDRVYINAAPPQVHDTICKNADYEVCKPPIITLNECEVLLKQRSGR